MVELFLITMCAATIRMATPILFAATGELFSELSGVFNVGLEGMMLMGAFTGFAGAYYLHNPWFGILSGMMGGALVGLIMGMLSISLGVSQILAGIGLNIFALGITSFFYRHLFGAFAQRPACPPFNKLDIPFLRDLPIVGPVFFDHVFLVYLCFLLLPVAWFLLYKTEWGLRVRMVGEQPLAADSMGVSISGIRYLCVMIAGGLAGLGGTSLSVGRMQMFFEHMTVERGFIAIAAVIYGKWRPLRMMVATLVFGMAEALQLRLQASGLGIPSQFLSMLPYVLVIFALVFRRDIVLPAALCVPYRKESA